jgi:Na+-transporting NADH:ubiquinone oxidoreductase subunit NqrF
MDNNMTSPISTPVQVTFQPGDLGVVAEVGEAWLAVAARAGIEIPTSCLQGSCGSCEVELESGDFNEVCRTCIGTVPAGISEVTVYLLSDPSW